MPATGCRRATIRATLIPCALALRPPLGAARASLASLAAISSGVGWRRSVFRRLCRSAPRTASGNEQPFRCISRSMTSPPAPHPRQCQTFSLGLIANRSTAAADRARADELAAPTFLSFRAVPFGDSRGLTARACASSSSVNTTDLPPGGLPALGKLSDLRYSRGRLVVCEIARPSSALLAPTAFYFSMPSVMASIRTARLMPRPVEPHRSQFAVAGFFKNPTD